jgi:hypothetical protein
LVFGVFDSASPVKVTFVRFEKSSDGTSTMAVLLLTNQAKQTSQILHLDDEAVACRFVSRSATDEVIWMPRLTNGVGPTRFLLYAIPPRSELKGRVQLPEDGRTGRVSVSCLPPPRSIPKFLRFVPSLLSKLWFARLKLFWSECHQEIQCPLAHPDGTVDPPRLVPKGERQTP